MQSGNLNFVEPSGPLQACNGTDLPSNSEGYGRDMDLSEIKNNPIQIATGSPSIRNLSMLSVDMQVTVGGKR